MITFLEGIIEERSPTFLVLNVNGVGYEIFITLNTYEDLASKGGKYRIFTHHHIREDAELLYGFSEKTERSFFLKLLGISGVGPALALNILGGLPVVTLCSAIASEDVKRLSSIKGVGKKTAERMIIELKDKVSQFAVAEEKQANVSAESKVINDAVLALVALGYRNAEAFSSVKRAMKGMDEVPGVEVIVRKALGSMKS